MFSNVFLMAGKLTTLVVKKHPTKQKLYVVLCVSTSSGIARASSSSSPNLRSAKPLSIPNFPPKKTYQNTRQIPKISVEETQSQKKAEVQKDKKKQNVPDGRQRRVRRQR
ncbi:hypothetical protein V6Z11_A06G176200 [Gossypium hirsutum]